MGNGWSWTGRGLQNDFQNSQWLWSRVKAPRRVSKKVDKICGVNGQVIGEEGVMERWKHYFSGLLQGGQQGEEGTKRDSGPGPTQEEESISIEEVVEAIAKLRE